MTYLNVIWAGIVTSIVWFIAGAVLYMNPGAKKISSSASKSPAVRKWKTQGQMLYTVFLAGCLVPSLFFAFIIVIVPVALVLGLVFAFRRSFWSLVCLGYPFTFGLISAWIGYKEMPGYERSTPSVISIGFGLFGCMWIAGGLWKALPGKTNKEGVVSDE